MTIDCAYIFGPKKGRWAVSSAASDYRHWSFLR